MNIPKSIDFISFKEVTVFLKSVLKKLPQLVDNELPFIDLLQSGCPPKAENVLSWLPLFWLICLQTYLF